MNQPMNRAEILQVFSAMGISPIDKGLEELRQIKNRDQLANRNGDSGLVHRVVLSNGTGNSKGINNNAELERYAHRAASK